MNTSKVLDDFFRLTIITISKFNIFVKKLLNMT